LIELATNFLSHISALEEAIVDPGLEMRSCREKVNKWFKQREECQFGSQGPYRISVNSSRKESD
jgi:hypothetical protein